MIACQLTLCTGSEGQSFGTPAICLNERVKPCPVAGCHGTLNPYPTPRSSYDSVTGFGHLKCEACGHMGMQVPNGLYLVFRGSDEYVFHHAPSLASLTIVASSSLLAPFTWHGCTPAQVVAFMAEWVLLTGRTTGMVQFAKERAALQDCYEYFRRHIVHERHMQTAQGDEERSHSQS